MVIPISFNIVKRICQLHRISGANGRPSIKNYTAKIAQCDMVTFKDRR